MIFFLLLQFYQFISLTKEQDELKEVDPYSNLIFMLYYDSYSKNYPDLIQHFIEQNPIEDTQDVFFFTVDCDLYPSICKKNRESIPRMTRYFPGCEYLQNSFNISENDKLEHFLSEALTPKVEMAPTDLETVYQELKKGGSAFILNAYSSDSPYVKKFTSLSRVFSVFGCSFYFTKSKNVKKNILTIITAENCIKYYKDISITKLPSIIYNNRFSLYHFYTSEEFDQTVDVENKSLLLFLCPNNMNDFPDSWYNKTSSLVCFHYPVGWTLKNANSIKNKVKAYDQNSKDIIIVNRESDCLFLMRSDKNLPESLYLNLVLDSFTKTVCWRYPPDSTKKPPSTNYFNISIIFSLLLTGIYFYINYMMKQALLPVNHH